MIKTDPFLTYRPLDSDVAAEWTAERSSRVWDSVLSSANSTRGGQKFTAARRKTWTFSSLATVGVAAAAITVVVALSGGPGGSRQTTPGAVGPAPTASDSVSTGPSGNTIVLAGYKITFPADYSVGKVDTNCTSDLHLSADERSRLITTPSGGCPLLVSSVRRDLPSGAAYVPYSICVKGDGDFAAMFTGGYAVKGPYDPATGSGENFVPARLPDGSTVYVTVDLFNIPPDKLVPLDANVSKALGCDTLTTQLDELAKGMEVSPTS